jgi:hypothetical protein
MSTEPSDSRRARRKTILIVVLILLGMMACGGVPTLVVYVCFLG